MLLNAVQAGEPERLQFSICHNPLAKVTVWGSCEMLLRRDTASVNYPT